MCMLAKRNHANRLLINPAGLERNLQSNWSTRANNNINENLWTYSMILIFLGREKAPT